MVQDIPPLPSPFSDTSYQLDVSLGVVQFHHHPLFSEEHVIAVELRQIYHQYTTKLEQDRPRMLREKVCFGILVSWCLYFQHATPISHLSSKHTPPPQLPLLLLSCPSSSAPPSQMLLLLNCPSSSAAPPQLPLLLSCPSSSAPPPQLSLFLSPVSLPHPTLYFLPHSPPFLLILCCRALPHCSSAQCPQTFSANTPGGSGRRGQLLRGMADTILAGHFDCACYHSVHTYVHVRTL